jgi:hypothetical protein
MIAQPQYGFAPTMSSMSGMPPGMSESDAARDDGSEPCPK